MQDSTSALVSFPVETVVESDMALYCVFESGEETWIPKSVIHFDSPVWMERQKGDLLMYKWFAKKKSLIK